MDSVIVDSMSGHKYNNDLRRRAIAALQDAVSTRSTTFAMVAPIPSHLQDVCLAYCYWNLGIPTTVPLPGYRWVLEDGNRMLQPHGFCNLPVPRESLGQDGNYVIVECGHAFAIRIQDQVGVKMDLDDVPEIMLKWDIEGLICNASIKTFRVAPIAEMPFLAGGFTPPWTRAGDCMCGAKKVTAAGVKKRPAINIVVKKRSGADIKYTELEHCPDCGPDYPLVKLSDDRHNSAKVWTGAQWITMHHGTKRCTAFGGCKSYLASSTTSLRAARRSIL